MQDIKSLDTLCFFASWVKTMIKLPILDTTIKQLLWILLSKFNRQYKIMSFKQGGHCMCRLLISGNFLGYLSSAMSPYTV